MWASAFHIYEHLYAYRGQFQSLLESVDSRIEHDANITYGVFVKHTAGLFVFNALQFSFTYLLGKPKFLKTLIAPEYREALE